MAKMATFNLTEQALGQLADIANWKRIKRPNGNPNLSQAVRDLLFDAWQEEAQKHADIKESVAVNGVTYDVILHPEIEDGGYWVECSAIEGCVSEGDTKEEALAMIADAIEGCLEVLAEK